MDLLNENEEQKKTKTKGQKMVLALLIISIILVIIIIALMIVLKPDESKSPIALILDGTAQVINTNDVIESGNGKKYIDLKYLCGVLGYIYEYGDYKTYESDTSKCYIKNDNLVFGMEEHSNTIYKYDDETDLDYQYFTLNNKVLANQNKLYIAIEDIPLALNIKCTIDKKNTINIRTPQYLAKQYQNSMTGYTITDNPNNLKALSYGWIIASKNGLWGVLDEAGNSLVSFRYNTIEFNEYNSNYIVSKDGAYGIIETTGKTEQALIFDDLKILNYQYGLYSVKSNNKYGVLSEKGNLIGEIIYDEVGYPENIPQKIRYTLIIPEYSDSEINIPTTIVVKKDNKYGLIDIETGEEILPCDHLDQLYLQENLGEEEYIVGVGIETDNLIQYLKYRKNNF